jgi:histone deacetylase 1/2
MNDMSYIELFKKIMTRICGFFVPDVMVIQCGADSLSKDILGHLNLSIKGHG